MSAFPTLSREALDPAQRAFWDEITLGSRGFYAGGPEARALPDLYNAWLQFPPLGHLMLRLADALRAEGALTDRLRELAVLTTSVLLGCRVEYDFHAPFAREHGLSDAVIAAIGADEAPPFENATDAAVHAAIVQLVRTGTLEPVARNAVIDAVGLSGLMQLIAAIGLYTVVSHTTNVAGARLADDFSADPEALATFFSGR